MVDNQASSKGDRFVPEKYTQIHKSVYFDEYKRIRNQLRKYHPYSILATAVKYLNHPVKNDMEQIKKAPWVIMLLVKWAFIDYQYNLSNRKKINNDQFMKIAQMIWDLSGKTRMPTQYSHHHLFFRNISYQQFIYQRSLNIRMIGRQVELFMNYGNFYKESFNEIVGIEIDKFLSLSVCTLAHFLSSNQISISEKYFSSLHRFIGEQDIMIFLSSISLKIENIRDELLKNSNQKREPYEYYEQTPFIAYPLIQVDQNYLCIHECLLYRCLENFIYDTLRRWNANKFMNKFGSTFERYVEKSIKNSGVNYICENTLKAIYGHKSQVVDFVIPEERSNIFIDAKGIEMPPVGKVAQVSEIIQHKTKDSILKAIRQAHETNLKIFEKNGTSQEVVKYHSKSYLVVITFKELYLGNGKTFHEAIASEKLNSIHREFPEHIRIPLENMYFLNVDELDLWTELVRVNKLSFTDYLDKAIHSDSNSETRKFDFNLHLRSWGAINYPQFIENSWQALFSPIVDVLKKS